MKKIKLLKILLWGLDICLALVTTIVIFNFLLFSESRNWLADLPNEDDRKIARKPTIQSDIYIPSHYRIISLLPNPIEVKKPPPIDITSSPRMSLANLIQIEGTMPNAQDPKRASAFIKILTKGKIVMTYYGEPILDEDGKEINELRGVKIVEVYLDRVVFDNNGKREELKASGGSEVPPIGKDGDTKPGYSDFDPSLYKSMQTVRENDRQVWEIDPKEAEWANKNQDDILNKDVTLSLYSSGGIKLDWVKEKSIVASRGLEQGDVIKSVNGRTINSLAEMRDTMNTLKERGGREIILNLNRAGRNITMNFKLKQ